MQQEETPDTQHTTAPRCPRCHGELRYVALSRATPEREIDICHLCGHDEAMLQWLGGGFQPVAAWPVERTYEQPPRSDV